MADRKKIAVIGAGASGLTATKSCKEEDFLPVCFERSNSLGGLWRYHEEDVDEIASVMRTTIINSSKERTAFSDFVPDKMYPNYMHNSKMVEHFERYAEHFDLLQHIRFNTEVLKVEPAKDFDENGRWVVSTRSKETEMVAKEIFDAVMVCVGHHVFPNIPTFPNQDKFKGTITHTHSLKSCDRYRGEKVVVVGIGNSGVDAAIDATYAAKQVYLSTRRGCWIFPRLGPRGYPLDLSSSRFNNFISSWSSYDARCDQREKQINSMFDHEVYNLKPNHRIFSAHPTMNDDIPCAILSGKVIVKGNVERFEENGVIFFGEKEVTKVDAVILATGYIIKFNFLADDILKVENNIVNLYKYIIPPKLKQPTLAFIGLVQPIGSVIPISEMQSRWFIQLLTGDMKLPSVEVMENEIKQKNEATAKRFVDSMRHKIEVEFLPYMDELAKMIKVMPNFLKISLKDPKLGWALITGPILTYQYRLNGPHSWPRARDAILSFKERVHAPLNTRAPQLSEKTSCLNELLFIAIKKIALLMIFLVSTYFIILLAQ